MIIIRTACNRPCALRVSLEWQLKCIDIENTFTYFLVDYPTFDIKNNIKDMKDVLDWYPLSKEIIYREYNYSMDRNFHEGLKIILDNNDVDFVAFLEEDVIVSKDFFKLLNVMQYRDFFKSDRVITFNGSETAKSNNIGDICITRYAGHRAMAFSKRGYNKYVRPYVEDALYRLYMGGDSFLTFIIHYYDLYSYESMVNRFMNIGISGHHIPQQWLTDKGKNFLKMAYLERYEVLKEICFSRERLCEYSINQFLSDFVFDIDFGDNVVLLEEKGDIIFDFKNKFIDLFTKLGISILDIDGDNNEGLATVK